MNENQFEDKYIIGELNEWGFDISIRNKIKKLQEEIEDNNKLIKILEIRAYGIVCGHENILKYILCTNSNTMFSGYEEDLYTNIETYLALRLKYKDQIKASCYYPNNFSDYGLITYFIESEQGDLVLNVSEIDLVLNKEKMYKEIQNLNNIFKDISNLDIMIKLESRFKANI